ncbi:3-hydroxyacyl-ACP dehydratase FabZ [Candidatus Finniella inopinata]|uniref:3-hydroxyacyl-[acyl-carrier-protein] dehydratase FabZ n=1 Tax=Candidatus Finniella inopinata TaxID=1696036 RepID=A0A4Q7DLV5_9PROT|nr:3-hydroxyacyl-ACP dehydratase FabZ [Candidatus Finniella inopinata]RZI45746.1 3-hydroxyacyl-ACP dehydratase FabZ [Candidatus Finniella inopinata]
MSIHQLRPQNIMQNLTINAQEIKELIPHRYPFLLIDRIEQVELGQSAVGIKNVSLNEWYFQGHFPEHPILPGVLIIEAMAQTAGALVVKTLLSENQTTEKPNNMVYFMSIEGAKFRKPVVPGDVLQLRVKKERSRGQIWKFKGEAWVGQTLTDEATFTAMIMDQ